MRSAWRPIASLFTGLALTLALQPHMNATLDLRPLPTEAPVAGPDQWRFGVGVPLAGARREWLGALGAGWYLTWAANPESVPGAEHWLMVRTRPDGLEPDAASLARLARRFPGRTWLIGNEPDVAEQDGVTPERYAELYRLAYRALKAADPGARIGPGGVAQASPLRLLYLDQVLEHYRAAAGEPLPADFWGAHLYVLREERGGWGAGIPVGLAQDLGWRREVQDHDDVLRLAAQIWDLRDWLADRGYRGLPLIVTEFGILMPAEFGFPPEAVAAFLRDSVAVFRSARDPALGDPTDGGRLVQSWAWFSLADSVYPVSDLVNLDSGRLTAVGAAYRALVEAGP